MLRFANFGVHKCNVVEFCVISVIIQAYFNIFFQYAYPNYSVAIIKDTAI